MIEQLEAIMAIMAEAFDPHWGEGWNTAQVLGSLQFPRTHVLIVDPAGQEWRAGSPAAGFLLSRDAPGEEELLLVAVRPQYRRKGLGGILIEGFLAQAQARGAEKVFLEMRENNEAGRLYRAHGFQPIGKRTKYYTCSDGSRLDAITFGRPV